MTKKLISILLIAAMLFSLASCGAQTITKDKYVLKIKGNGTKKMTIAVEDSIPEYTQRDMVLVDGLGGLFNVDQKEKGHTITYTFTGNNTDPEASGSQPAVVKYYNGEETVGTVTFQIAVDGENKVYMSNVFFNQESKYKPAQEGDEYEISEYESGTRTVRLENGKGEWKIGTYDDIVSVLDPETSEGYTEITMMAQKEGEGFIQLINRKEESQLHITLSVTGSEEEGFILNLTDTEKKPFTPAEDTELIEKNKAAKASAAEVLGEYYLPDWAYVGEISSYNEKSGKPDKSDTVDVTIEGNDVLYDYVVSKGVKYEAKIKEFAELEIESEQDMTVAGNAVHYMFFKNGFAAAVWQSGESVCTLTVVRPNTDAECQKAVKDFFG